MRTINSAPSGGVLTILSEGGVGPDCVAKKIRYTFWAANRAHCKIVRIGTDQRIGGVYWTPHISTHTMNLLHKVGWNRF